MDQAIRLKSGKMGITVNQCDSLGRISIKQDVPFPAEVLNIAGRVAIGDEPRFQLFNEDLPDFFVNCEIEEAPPPTCPNNFPVLPQEIVQVGYFNNAIFSASDRTSWGLITAAEEIQTVTLRATFEAATVHFHDGVRDIYPRAAFGTTNFHVGQSDEPSFYRTTGNQGQYFRFTAPDAFTQINSTYTPGNSAKIWCQSQGKLLLAVTLTFTSPAQRIDEFDVSGATGTFIRSPSAWNDITIRRFGFTPTHYFIMWVDGAVIRVSKVRRSDFATVASVDLTTAGISSPKAMAIVDDNFFYVVGTTGVPVGSIQIAHVQNMSTVTIVDSVVTYAPLTNNFGLGGTQHAFFLNNHLYWGGDGADGSPHIYKFGPFNC